MSIPQLQIGSSITIQKVVGPNDTAANVGSGALSELLSTPALVSLIIDACVRLVDPNLEGNNITIGKSLSVSHENPTIQGATVTVKATLTEQQDNRLTFECECYDEIGQIGQATHVRYIVNRLSLLRSAEERHKVIKPQ